MNHYESRISHVHINQIFVITSYKLKEDNFLTWKLLLPPLLKRYKVSGFIDRSIPYPPYLLNDEVNPAYSAWHDDDNTLILWIQLSISDTVISYVVSADNSKELWEAIESIFARSSSTHSTQLHLKLQYLRLGSGTVSSEEFSNIHLLLLL